MKLLNQILNMRIDAEKQRKALDDAANAREGLEDMMLYVYKVGYRDARHQAAELACMVEEEWESLKTNTIPWGDAITKEVKE